MENPSDPSLQSSFQTAGEDPSVEGKALGVNSRVQLKRLGGFVRPYYWHLCGAIVALVVAAGTVLALGRGLQRLIDDGFASGDAALLDQALIVLFVVVAVLAIASASRFYLISWIGERVVADIRRAVYNHVVGLSPGFFDTTRTGEILSRLTTDTTLIQVVVGSSGSMAVRNILLLVGGVVMLAITSPILTGMVLLVVPLVVVPIVIFGRKVRALSKDTQSRIADVGVYVEESLNALRTVQAFTHEALDRRNYGSRVEAAFKTSVARIRARAWLTGAVIFMVFGAVGVLLWVGGKSVMADEITAGELSAFLFYSVVVAGAVGALSEVVGDVQRAIGASERLFDLLDVKPQVKSPEVPVALPQPARGAVEFENVTFNYPSLSQRSALKDIRLVVAPGEKVALVGPSGAGKTTLFQLLLRFYDPQTGRITLDGVDLKDGDLDEIRQHIGIVTQDPVVFAASAWENIRYGRPEATDNEVRAAARAAAAEEFLVRLPDGFDSYLGERGVLLSGGQRQRIAIARTILRNPAVLLLDEATSALDSENERLVQDALEKLESGRTTLIIAHRLATVMNADRIVVLDQGRIVGVGSHEELMKTSALYSRLASLQFDEDAFTSAIGTGNAEPLQS